MRILRQQDRCDDLTSTWDSLRQVMNRSHTFRSPLWASLLPVCNQLHWNQEDELNTDKTLGVGGVVVKFSLFTSFTQEGT